ncbi:hypothetical protein L1887_31315 [Cichorium endivia]|nr:hypothetical protein L1887_31315 [Cichorium endivia]
MEISLGFLSIFFSNMEDYMRTSFKRPHNPNFENAGNKRGKFNVSEQFSENLHSSDTVYRILCPSRKIGGVIGKGGGIIKALREETQAKITVDDFVPGSEERVVIIHSPSTKKPVVKQNDMEVHCAAQDALLKVHDRILEEDIVGGNNNNNNIKNEKLVTTRLLLANNMVGCLLGKRGDVIQRLRKETGANIRILPENQLPVCALSTDELVQISAKPAIVKKALYEISTLLHQNPRKDNPIPSGPHGFRPPGPPMINLSPPVNPIARWRDDFGRDQSRFDHGGDTPTEFSMKILCSKSKIGGVIGKGGSNIRQIQQEFGTNIHVDDVAADSDERVICVSSCEDLWNPRSRTIDTILVLQDKTSEHDEKGIVTSRLLMSSSKVGCLLGQKGQVINEMRRRTKADIRVFSKEEKPKCAGKDEELVQVCGLHGSVKDALIEIASRYRERCLRDTKPEPPLPRVERPSPRLPGFQPFKGGGRREYEPYSHTALSRDHEPYSHLAPLRDYETYSHEASLRDYEPRVYRDYEYESNTYIAPRMGGGYPSPSPPRDYEPPQPPQGYLSSRFLGGVDLKMPSTSRLGVDNFSEIPRTRSYGGGSESSIPDIHGSYSTRDTYQTYNLPKRPSRTQQEPYTNINPPYNLYQNNPPHQEHYSQNSYQH